MDEETQGSVPSLNPKPGGEQDEADLFYYLQVVRKHRLLVGGGTLAAVVLSAAVSFFLPKEYEAQATLMPLSRNTSRISTLLSNLGSLADLAGMGETVPEEGADLLVNVLESRVIARRVIEREDLLPALFPSRVDAATGSWAKGKPEMSEAEDAMRQRVLAVSNNNRGMITVSARFGDPAIAARIANAAVGEMEAFLKEHQVSASARTGAFLEKRKKEASGELQAAEEALREFCERNGVISMPDQTRLLFEQIASLSSEAATRRAKLEVVEAFGGASNPEASCLRAEILSLDKEILKLERGPLRTEGPFVQTNGFIPLYDVPEKSLQYARLVRETKVKQEVYAFLQTELEAARIRQSRDEISFTLLDAAAPPLGPIRPKPILIVGLAAVFSGLAAFMLALFLEHWERRRAAGGGAPAV